MAGIARVGDFLGMGGLLTAPASSSVTVNGRPVALMGCVYTPHIGCTPATPQHCVGITIDMDAGVSIEGQIPLTKGAKGICGHGVMSASDDVIIMGGGFGILGSLAGAALGQLDFGTSDLGGLASGFSDAASGFTGALDSVTSSISAAVGGGELGKIIAGVAVSTAKSIAIKQVQG